MLVVDVLIVVVLVVALIAGLRRGLLASLGTILGLVVGGLAAFWLLPLVSAWVPSPIWRGAASSPRARPPGPRRRDRVGDRRRAGTGSTALRLRASSGSSGAWRASSWLRSRSSWSPRRSHHGRPAVSTAIYSSRVLQGSTR